MLGVVQRLSQLRAVQLHRLAVLLGTPCSGTKAIVVKGIQDAVVKATNPSTSSSRDEIRTDAVDSTAIKVVSIDMGIKNLAYAVLSTTSLASTRADVPKNASHAKGAKAAAVESRRSLQNICLEAWQKIDISYAGTEDTVKDDVQAETVKREILKKRGSPKTKAATAPYHPADYSLRAYTLIQDILTKHKPTHIIIERQRFRSGGGANVQEWTIRVGMFEGMLWAVLRTLIEQSKNDVGSQAVADVGSSALVEMEVEPVLPARVNRFWLEMKAEPVPTENLATEIEKAVALKGREIKKAKIGIASYILSRAGISSVHDAPRTSLDSLSLELTEQAETMARNFQDEVADPPSSRRKKKSSEASSDGSASSLDVPDAKISKLDDLADCLLQGLAWLHWQRNRNTFAEHGPDALLLEPSVPA